MALTMAFSNKATTDDTAVACLAAQSGQRFSNIAIFNDGSVSGWFSIDGGVVWRRLPARTSRSMDGVVIGNVAVQIKRTASGSNMTKIHGDVW